MAATDVAMKGIGLDMTPAGAARMGGAFAQVSRDAGDLSPEEQQDAAMALGTGIPGGMSERGWAFFHRSKNKRTAIELLRAGGMGDENSKALEHVMGILEKGGGDPDVKLAQLMANPNSVPA